MGKVDKGSKGCLTMIVIISEVLKYEVAITETIICQKTNKVLPDGGEPLF
ncbi:hypothetical protein MXMO3_00275 [Maritalea myrionectae]|uniref:Uncharacterized protein n=1 Tax=Maritalea myrionectae TaxID=454601 RepID=A0A2R4MA15_9HYPH|nr:hypothetical protein MXMO3_00275 [Maritalea myrionectae]